MDFVYYNKKLLSIFQEFESNKMVSPPPPPPPPEPNNHNRLHIETGRMFIVPQLLCHFSQCHSGEGGGSIIITFFTHLINDCSPHN